MCVIPFLGEVVAESLGSVSPEVCGKHGSGWVGLLLCFCDDGFSVEVGWIAFTVLLKHETGNGRQGARREHLISGCLRE